MGLYPFLKKILVLNKSDLEDKRDINFLEINDFLYANKILDLESEEISLKTKENVDKLLYKINIGLNKMKNQIPINIVYESGKKTDSNEKNISSIKSTITIILIGDSSVGKSCFLGRYFHNKFSDAFLTTTGIDKQVKTVKINDTIYKLSFWDTAGQERFRSLPKKYYQNADGIFLFYDVTNTKSFENIIFWVNSVKDCTGAEKRLTLFLIGNKIDLPNREVTREEAEELANSLGMKYYEVSNKINMNINEVVSRMIMECHMNLNNINDCFSLSKSATFIGNKKNDNNNGCCGGKKTEPTVNKEPPRMRESLETIKSDE